MVRLPGGWLALAKEAANRLYVTSGRAEGATTSRFVAREALGVALYTNSFFLMAHAAVTSISGVFFWVLAARMLDAGDVGRGAALISAALLLTFIARFGLEFGLVRFLPTIRENPSGLINSCFLISATTSMVLAGIFLIGAPFWTPQLAFVGQNILLAAGFVAVVTLAPIYAILTQVYIAARRSEFTVLQGSLMSVLKIGALPFLIGTGASIAVFASWGLAIVVAMGVGLLLYLPRVQPQYRLHSGFQGNLTRGVLRFSLANYVSAGFSRMPTLILPLMVVNSLGAELNAFFFVAWAVVGHILAIPISIGDSLFSIGSAHQDGLQRYAIRSLRLTAGLLLPTVLVAIIAAEKLLQLFGEEYASAGSLLLRLLAVSALPAAANSVYLAMARVQKSLGRIMIVSGIVAGLTLGLSLVLIPVLGILGPGIAWLAANTVATTISVPGIIRAVRRSGAPLMV